MFSFIKSWSIDTMFVFAGRVLRLWKVICNSIALWSNSCTLFPVELSASGGHAHCSVLTLHSVQLFPLNTEPQFTQQLSREIWFISTEIAFQHIYLQLIHKKDTHQNVHFVNVIEKFLTTVITNLLNIHAFPRNYCAYLRHLPHRQQRLFNLTRILEQAQWQIFELFFL